MTNLLINGGLVSSEWKIDDPGATAGAQLTALHPTEWAFGILIASHDPSPNRLVEELKFRM